MAATDVVVVIGGIDVTPFARIGRVRIDDLLNDAPNTAALSIVATPRPGAPQTGPFDAGAFDAGAYDTIDQTSPILTPPPIKPGAPIAVYLGTVTPATQLFGGQITVREQYAELEVPAHVRYDLSCIDWTRRLNYRTVTWKYGQASATGIVTDLVARFAPAITANHVQAALPTVDGGMTFTFEDVSGALSRLATVIGAYWYVDYTGDLHFFIGTEAGASPAPLVPGGRFSNLKIAADLTQVRTRVILEGAGGTAAASIAGAALIPLSTVDPFNPGGGFAKVGTTIVSYARVQAGGATANTVGVAVVHVIETPSGGASAPAAPAAPSVAVAPPSTAGGIVGGPFYYSATFELGDGRRSDLGAPSTPITIAPAANPPPTNGALNNPPAPGPINVGVTSIYATAFVDAAGRQTAAPGGGANLTGRAVAAPATGPGGSVVSSGGRIPVGSFYYAMTYVTARGETLASGSGLMSVVNPNSQVQLTLPTSADTRVKARRIYRSSNNPSLSSAIVEPWRLVLDVPDNSTVVGITDVYADSELGPRPLPAFTTATDTGESAVVTVPVSGDARIVGRRLYRKDGAGEYRLIAELRDNSTTTFSDVVPGIGGDLAPAVNTINTGAALLTAIPIGPAGTVRRRLFRTTTGVAAWRELTAINDNTTTTYTDTLAETALGGSPLPPAGIPAGEDVSVTIDPPPPTAAGATRMQVDTLAGIPASGWISAEEQLIRYASTSSSGGVFYLEGIPASGPGAVTADIPAGTVIATVPAIAGISPAVTVAADDDVNILVYVDDTAAQSALAAVEGGDGILEHYIQDRRLSEAGARARGEAELALFKTIELKLSYTTHDPETRSGRTVHVDLPAPTNLTGDFLIQRVTIDDVAMYSKTYPRRHVDASTTRFSFEDVLARLLMEQR